MNPSDWDNLYKKIMDAINGTSTSWTPISGQATVARGKSDASFFGGRGETHSTVYGLRNWNIDNLGRLVGKIYKTAVWMPGENQAKCLRGTYNSTVPVEDVAAMGEPDHDMSDCSHGFYAYYDGSRDYHDNGDVTGVIKGWGEAVVGDKGFRVTRAEIVAIMFDEGATTPQQRARIMSLYPQAAVFTSLDAMLTEYPTTAGDLEYVPDADDDFWTREA